MSYVTNVLVLTSSLNDDPPYDEPTLVLDALNAFLVERDPEQKFKHATARGAEDWYGGYKAIEAEIFAGAFNYIELNEFLSYVRSRVRSHSTHCPKWTISKYVQGIRTTRDGGCTASYCTGLGRHWPKN